jgi:hypothetical protein
MRKNWMILGCFSGSLLPVVLFRRLPWLKYRSRAFRVVFSLATIFIPTNLVNLYLLSESLQLEGKVYSRHEKEFERYLDTGDVRAFGGRPVLA